MFLSGAESCQVSAERREKSAALIIISKSAWVLWNDTTTDALPLHHYAGIVKTAKMDKTIIVRRNYAHFIKKYAR